MESWKLGLVGCSQLSFSGDKEGVYAASAKILSRLSEEWSFDLYIYPHQVVSLEDAQRARQALEAEQVDFLLLQCTSFSAGALAPVFARMKEIPLGLWAVPEVCENGPVALNSFCGIGMYASIIGHYLKDYQIPLKWYYGRGDEELFRRRLGLTIRALRAIKAMRHSRVALVGGIAPGFDDLYDDERRLIGLFDGMQINRLHEYEELNRRAVAMDHRRVARRMEEEIAAGKGRLNETLERQMEINARFSLAFDDFVTENSYDALAVSCWPKFQEDYEYAPCAVVGELNDKGVVAACEGDLTSAVSMLLLQYLSEDIPTLMDLSAMDPEDDTLLLWHCGPASKRFCEKRGFTYGLNYSGVTQEPGAARARGIGVVRDMVFDPGPVTIGRLTGECDRMLVAGGELLDSEKAGFCGSRGWIGRLTLHKEPVSALDFFNTLFAERFQHHFPMVRGNCQDELLEAMAWLGLKPLEPVFYQDVMQNPSWWD